MCECGDINVLGVVNCAWVFMWFAHFFLAIHHHCVLIGSVHKSVAGSLNPRKITCLLYITSHFDLVNTTEHPALHSTQMPINDAIVNLGTMCPVKIVGRPGIVMSHMCVDFTLLPSVDSQRLRQRSQIVDRSTFHDKYGSCTGVCNCLVFLRG